jgi:lipopolysaccharide/colanic/teichoic acid biosynthesis glycosyltransferase
MDPNNAILDTRAPAIPGALLERPIRALRWPRQRSLSVLLSTALIAVLAFPAVLWARDADHGVGIVVVAALLAAGGRIAFELPVRAACEEGPLVWLLSGVRSATVAVAVGVLAGAMTDHLPATGAIVGSWTAMTALLVAAAAARRAEVAYRTGSRLFVVGSTEQVRDLRCEAALRGDLQVVEHCDPTAPTVAERLLADLREARATVLVLSDEALRCADLVRAAVHANLAGIRVRDLRSFYEQELGKVATSELSLTWFLFDIAAIHRRRLYGTTKRVVEVLVAGALLMATAPLFPLIALAIKLASPGPVLFRQPRVGLQGRCFTLAKFRTMHVRSGEEHGRWAADSGDRLFGVGRVLRRLRLDELPQLLLVVRGELSLVGPRPEQPAIAQRVERELRFYAARQTVRPGLTGWAQVNLGYAGSDAGTLAKLQYDLFYIKHQGLLLDLRIMASTARAVLFGGGS